MSLALEPDQPPTGPSIPNPHVPKSFLESATLAAVHRDPTRWNLLYRLLYRLQTNRALLQIETDDDVAYLLRLTAQVRRDLHKMHAFVRFRKVLKPGEPTLPDERPTVLDEPLTQTDPTIPEPHTSSSPPRPPSAHPHRDRAMPTRTRG